MKKVWAVLLLLVAAGQVYADEGMWVLKELNKQNLARIKELSRPISNSTVKPTRVWPMLLLFSVADVPVLPYRKKD